MIESSVPELTTCGYERLKVTYYLLKNVGQKTDELSGLASVDADDVKWKQFLS